jgi:hypothetical protein
VVNRHISDATAREQGISKSLPHSSSQARKKQSRSHRSLLYLVDPQAFSPHLHSQSKKMAAPAARTMRAAVLHAPGLTAKFTLEPSWPIPVPQLGQVLIRVKAFGINRSELFTRLGYSPGLVYPRILGIEATGVVEEAPGSDEFKKGDIVATCMGGMGMFNLMKFH